jgi:hypothetical protein
MWLSYQTVLTANPCIEPAVILGPTVWTILAVTGLVAGRPSQSASTCSAPLIQRPAPQVVAVRLQLPYFSVTLCYVCFPSVPTVAAGVTGLIHVSGIAAVHSARQFQ